MMQIGKLLRRYRKEREITQKQLARLMGKGWTNYIVSRVENGHQLPSPEYIKSCSEALELLPDEKAEIKALYEQEILGEAARLYVESGKVRHEDWGEAPDVVRFYGREREIEDLLQWVITDRCRLVGILGMGGVGKTALARELAELAKEDFDCIFWRSLINVPPIERVLFDCISHLSDSQGCLLPRSPDEGLLDLIRCLRDRRCLIVLDNLEAILRGGYRAGYYREGCEFYGRLIQQVAESQHRSCLILTSREKPREFALLESDASPARALQLRGMETADGRAILRDRGLYGSSDLWANLVNRYSGNPLALKIVSETIREIFDGNIASFLEEELPIFGGVNDLLGQQLDRLTDLEREIIYWLAVEREAVSWAGLQENIVRPVSKARIVEALASLHHRFLIERRATGFTLQNVIMEYTTDCITGQVFEEIVTGSISLFSSLALIKASAKDYIRDSQARLILKPIIDRLCVSLDQGGVEKRLKGLLVELPERLRESGYASGNILNLLAQIGVDLAGCDFSHLTIRQAYLPQTDLHDVDFSYSDLTSCVFAEAFVGACTIDFSPDKRLLAAGYVAGDISIWQWPSLRQLFNIKGHTHWVRSVAFSPDGETLVSAGLDQTIRFWDITTGQCIKVIQDSELGVERIVFNPDGTLFATGDNDGLVKLWRTADCKCLNVLRGHTDCVKSIAFSPSGKLLVSGGYDHTVRMWDIGTARCLKTFQEHSAWVLSVAFNPAGNKFASGGTDGTVRLWDVHTEQCQILEGHIGKVASIAFSPDGVALASGGSDQTIRLWDTEKVCCQKVLSDASSTSNWIRVIAFDPSGRTLVSGSDNEIIAWDVHTGYPIKRVLGYSNSVKSICFHPTSPILASGGSNRVIQLWNVNTGRCFKTLRGHANWVMWVAFSPDGYTLASASEDLTIKLWDVHQGQCLKTLRGHTNWIVSVAFDSTGSIIASGSGDKTVRLWDVESGQCLSILRGHVADVTRVAFSPTNAILASGSNDFTLRLWDIDTTQCVGILSGHTGWIWAVAFNIDGHLIASGGSDQAIILWDARSGKCIRKLSGHADSIHSVSFSPDGHVLVSGSNDKTVRIWDVQTGQCLQILSGHADAVKTVAFNYDGRIIASGSEGGVIKLWDTSDGRCLETLVGNRLYEGMNITGVRGLTEARKASLRRLGALDSLLGGDRAD